MKELKSKFAQYQNEKEVDFRILSLPVDKGGCGYMRIRAPFKYMNKIPGVDAKVMEMDKELTIDEFKKAVSMADIVIARPGAQRILADLRKYFPFKKVITDFDDDLFNILPSSEHYRTYGKDDVFVETKEGPIQLWRDGYNGFDKFENRKRLIAIEWMMDTANVVTAVTERLAEHLSRIAGKEVRYIPNCTDFGLYPDVEVKDPHKGEEFRIGYCGGMSHNSDVEMIKQKMIIYLKKNPNSKLYLIGHGFETFDEVKDQVIKCDWMPFEANPFRMKTLDLDVMIAPLEDNVFNMRKDPLKLWDSGGLQVPLIASNVPPFSDVIEDGVNGFLFDTPKDMVKLFYKLEKNRELGKKIGKQAREYVFKERNLEKLVPNLVELYRQIAFGNNK